MYSNVARHRHDVGVVSIPTVTDEEFKAEGQGGHPTQVAHHLEREKVGTTVPLDRANFVVNIVYPPP